MIKKRLIVCGMGNVGKHFARLIVDRRQQLQGKYGLDIQFTAVVDIGGAAVSTRGPLPMTQLLTHIEKGGTVETFAGCGQPGLSGSDAIAAVEADVLIETTPTNLSDGEPGHGHFQAALEKGLDIISANKGPLVLFYKKLLERAKKKKCRIYMSAATAAALPTLDVGRLCLAGAEVESIDGILNGTTNYILTRMHIEKCAYDTALKAAQDLGIAETDPTLDVQGLDTRNKILLIANQVFEENFRPQDVPTTGIVGITPEEIEQARSAGQVIKLVGTARKDSDGVTLRVEPKALDREHPLAGINYSEKGISYLTDTMGRITLTGGKSSPVGAAAALLKDLIHSSIFASPL